MGTRIAAITMIKDECDIIELYVKVNLRSVDHIYILDHNSQDSTLDILLRLREQGLPISLYRYDSLDYNQGAMLTLLAKQVAATNEYDYIISVDADEFIYSPTGNFRQEVGEQVPQHTCGRMRWVTYVPAVGAYHDAKAPLYEVFRQRSKEPKQHYKVVIPNELAKVCTISMGSHLIQIDGQWTDGVPITPVLQHLPVRSVEQIMAKTLVGSNQVSILPGRTQAQASHWDLMANQIRAANYQVGHADMLNLAYLYAAEGQATEPPSFDDTAPRVGGPDDVMTMPELARINLVRKFDLFSASLCKEINKLRAQVPVPAAA